MSLSADLAAIDRYIKGSTLNTSTARAVRDEWTVWYDTGWGMFDDDTEVYDHARNLRNRFNLANAKTSDQKAAASKVLEGGMTSEEAAGDTRRALSDGSYAEPLLSSSTRSALMLAGIIAVVGWTALKAAELQISTLSRIKD